MTTKSKEETKPECARLAGQLAVLRESLGMSQQALAAEVGITRQTYAKIERGENQIGYTIYLAFLYYFQSRPETARLLEELSENGWKNTMEGCK